MSGDVQPRKRKDKKRKKDDLGVEEPRGTAAVFGEGDVFIHSQHDHGTGGHWCAKVIFFSLLAVLVSLIGLIILENRGLTELEANSVESRYSGVLDGWLEDSPDDDHHDAHTLELKHHDDEDVHDISDEIDHEEVDEDDHEEHDDELEEDNEDQEEDDGQDSNLKEDDEEDNDDNEETEEDDEEDEVSQEQDNEDDDDDENEQNDDQQDDEENESLENADEDNYEAKYKKYSDSYTSARDDDDNDEDEDDNDDYLRKINEDDKEQSDEKNLSFENFDNEEEYQNQDDEDDNDSNDEDTDEEETKNDVNSNENDDTEEDLEDHDEAEDDDNIEVERIEKEVSEEGDDEPVAESDEDVSQIKTSKVESQSREEEASNDADPEDIEDEEIEFLEPDDDLPEVIEPITAPPGKPLVEVEEETSSEKPPDTLAEEEEYEKQQEELRRQKEEGSHVWLKLVVGGALLVATHAVVRRATAPRDIPGSSERVTREETPINDRHMTLIPEEPVVPPAVPRIVPQESPRQVIEKEVMKTAPIVEVAPEPVEESEEELEEEEIEEILILAEETKAVEDKDSKDKELYSDEDDVEEEEEAVEEKQELPKAAAPVQSPPISKEKTPEPEPEPDDVSEDVEIIDDDQLEDDLEEEEDGDEEEVSDVDDAELLSRLEAKYGKLPAPERPGRNPKDGGQSLEDDWPGEPSDPYWRRQLDQAERDFQKGEWSAAAERAGGDQLRGSARARWVVARALDSQAEAKRDNRLLSRAITVYLDLLKMNERLSDEKLLQVTARTIDRIQFRGNYLNAEPVYRLLIRRFPNDVSYRNNLTVSFLMANRVDLAEEALKETLKLWPNDRVALAHSGFVLKTQHNRLEEAVKAFQKALEGDTGPANEPRFYYHLGDALLLLGRFKEAHEVHKRGAALGHFLSPAQRSLYNVERLKSRPWWNIDDTPYVRLARALEKSWREILKEGEAARASYEQEKEGLRERGEWSQLDLFVRGREIPDRCRRAPVTCSIVKGEPAAVGCRRGQVKFSSMEAGTHVRPHVGPTNCRLRVHLGLSNTQHTYLRVDQETRQWQTGKVLMFDDSFEHEVWHNGTGTRLVLIVDVWHPELTPAERRQLPAI